jgi:nitrate/nitrite transport system permease protein
MRTKIQNFLIDAVLLPAVGIVICLMLWGALSAATYDAETGSGLPSPVTSWEQSRQYFVAPFTVNEDEGYRGIGLELFESLKLVGNGYLAAILVAVPLGFALGSSKVFARMFDPVFQVLRPVSPLAWFPLAGVLVLPLKISLQKKGMKIDAIDWQCIFTIAICAIWPTILNTAVGVRAIPQDYHNVAKVLQLGPWKRFSKILLPATLPYMFTGFRLSLGIAWLVIVAAEMLAGKAGIGYFLWNSYNGGNYGAMVASIIVIGSVGFVLDRIMTLLEKNATTIVGLPALAGRFIKWLRAGRELSVVKTEVANATA